MLDQFRIAHECIKLFHSKGIKVSMDELASSLKISKRTIYENFSSKTELVNFVLNYFSDYLDKNYQMYIDDNRLSDYEKIESILNIIPQELCFTNEQKKSIKETYPDIYQEYIKRIDLRWNKIFNLVDKILINDFYKAINKSLIRVIYISSLEEIAQKAKTNEEFNEYKKGVIQIIIKAIQSSTPVVTGGVKLLDLLAKFSIGVLVFDINDKFSPIYMSKGYYSLFDENEVNPSMDVFSKIYEDDMHILYEAINSKVGDHDTIQIEYRIKTNKGIKWHRTRCIRIEIEGYQNAFLGVISDTTDIHEKESELRLEKERLAQAFEQTDVSIWEYDIKTKKLFLSDKLAKLYGYNSKNIYDVPRSVISSGKVHKNSIDTYNQFYKDILDGRETGKCVIQHINNDNKYIWIKLSYKTIYENEKPVKAIGIIEKQEDIVNIISKFEQEKSFVNILKNELLLTIQYNVSNKKIRGLHVNKELEYNFIDENYTYQEFFEAVLSHIANKEDEKLFYDLFNEDQLNEYFEISKSSKHLNYRSKDKDGNIKWLSYTVNFLYEPFTGSRYIFGYVRDIDNKMKLELELNRKVEYDLITRVYIEQVMKNITNYAIYKNAVSNNDCFFAIIELEKLNQIKRLYGLDGAEKILFHIGRILRICFNNKYIVGRIPEKQFAIFFPKVEDKKAVRLLVENALISAVDSYTFSSSNLKKVKLNVSLFSTSINRASFERLYENCNKQLELIEGNDELLNIVDNFDDLIDQDNIQDLYDLNSEDSDFFNQSKVIKKIMSYSDTEQKINYILKIINDYYGAFRTSIFKKEDKFIKIIYENTVGNIIDFDNFEIDITKYPALIAIDRYKKLAIVNDVENIKNIYPKEYNLMKSYNLYSIIVIPLIDSKKVIAYLTITNQKTNINKKDFAITLSYFLGKEIIELNIAKEEKFLLDFDEQTNLQNYKKFGETINNLKHNAISSLGICCVKLNHFREMTYEYGLNHTNELITKLATILTKIFNLNELYRFDNDTFYILSIDVDYESFKKKINKLIKELSKNMTNLINIGFTWSDVDLNVEKMLKHAEELMKLNPLDSKDNNKEFNEKLKELDYALDANWFEVFLQPKFNTIDKTIVAAEALLRINHPQYGIISPAQFIPILEKDKLIGKVDLYVFEQVCKILQRWKKEKRKLIPISINYSRVTILENGIMKKTLALMKKYKIDSSLIEIEITESVGNLEKQTLINISKSFIENGIRLTLDDFGSEYSNLNTLALIPFYAVKLDKSLINDIVTNKRNQILVENVILTCNKLGINTVIEGVETELQYQEIKKYNCGLIQGYYFDKPIRVSLFEEKYNSIDIKKLQNV